jgi:hypothetical protein
MASPYLNELTALQTSIQSFTSGLKQNFLTSADLLSANSIDYNVPFFTGHSIDGNDVWAVVVNFGVLPNQSTKVYLLGQTILNHWGTVGERWIDSGNSFFYNPTNGDTGSLPHTSELDFQGGKIVGSQVAIYLSNTEIIMHTQSDRSDYYGIVALKYLKPTQP